MASFENGTYRASLTTSVIAPTEISKGTTHVADAAFNKTIRIICLYVIIVVGLIGGVLVLLWIYQNRRRKSRVNALILNVAVSDLLVICYSCVFQVIWEHFDRLWLAGNVMCKLLKWLQVMAIMASTNQLVVLSIDRMQAIISPLRRPFEVWKMASIAWLAAALLSSPQLYIFSTGVITDEQSPLVNTTVCESIFRHVPPSHRKAYLTFAGLAVFYIPLLIICVCYVAIFLKIAQKAKRDTRKGCSEGNHSRPGKIQLTSTANNSLPKAKIKTLKMTIVIVLSFVVCSLPYHILEMIYSYGNHKRVPDTLAAILGAMAVANSATNPYVFLLFNVNMQCIKGLFTNTSKKRTYFESMNSTRTEVNTTHTELMDGHVKMVGFRGGKQSVTKMPGKNDKAYVRIGSCEKSGKIEDEN